MSNSIIPIILIALIVIMILSIIATYNRLAKLRINVDEGFSTMDVYLKKRYDLIPNLVETIKGYDKHESTTLKEVIEARNKAVSAKDTNGVVAANQTLGKGLNQLFALAESYPDLKANTNYIRLQEELSTIETDIANARLYYNGNVKVFNSSIVVFPAVILANMLGFKAFTFFESTSIERDNVKVNFN